MKRGPAPQIPPRGRNPSGELTISLRLTIQVGPAPRDPEHVKLVQGYVPTYKEVPEPKGFA